MEGCSRRDEIERLQNAAAKEQMLDMCTYHDFFKFSIDAVGGR
jgi:hypothetical protein